MRCLSIILLCSMILLMTNCATSGSSTPAQKNQTFAKTFKTGDIHANFRLNSAGLGRTIPILYQVKAYCADIRCKAAKAVLSFYLGGSGSGIYISNRNLSIQAGDLSYHWSPKISGTMRSTTSAGGRIVAAVLTKSELQQIAESKKVTVTLVGNHYTWSYSNRKPLRMLVQKLK